MAQKDIVHKVPLHTLKNTDEVRDLYDDWSQNDQYNQDMIDWEYSGPREVVSAFLTHAQNKDIKILDAGCGSGLVGEELSKEGYSIIHGADIAAKLMHSIPAGIYHELHNIDLNKPINFTDDFFDAVLCVGTFTFGHVKAKALSEFTRIVKSGGIIGFTINEGVFLDHGFKSELDHLVIQKKITQLDFYLSDYLSSKGVKAWLGIYRVN